MKITVYEYKENFVVNTIGCKEETMLLYLFIPPTCQPSPLFFVIVQCNYKKLVLISMCCVSLRIRLSWAKQKYLYFFLWVLLGCWKVLCDKVFSCEYVFGTALQTFQHWVCPSSVESIKDIENHNVFQRTTM